MDSVDAVSPTAADLTLGRRLKALLIGLLLLAVVIVAVARVNWHFLGRITVAATESGDRIAVSVSSLSGRPGFADLTAVAYTTEGRVLRIESNVRVPASGKARFTFDFKSLLAPGEHLASFKVKK